MTQALHVNAFVSIPNGAAPGQKIVLNGRLGVSVRVFGKRHAGMVLSTSHPISTDHPGAASISFFLPDEDASRVKPGVTLLLESGSYGEVARACVEQVLSVRPANTSA